MTTKARVKDIIAKTALLDADGINETDVLSDIGIASVQIVEAVFDIETEFDIIIDMNMNDVDFKALTVKAIIDMVQDEIDSKDAEDSDDA